MESSHYQGLSKGSASGCLNYRLFRGQFSLALTHAQAIGRRPCTPRAKVSLSFSGQTMEPPCGRVRLDFAVCAYSLAVYPNSFLTTSPCTSVSRKSRPWKRYVSFVWSKPKQVQDRRVQVVDVDAVFDGVEAELVGFAERDARFDAAAGQPHRERVGVMVAAVVAAALDHRRAAELAAPDHQRVVQQARAASGP